MAILNYGGMIQQGLGNLGGQLMQAQGQREARQERQANQDALNQASQLYSTGTPDEIAQFSIQNPQAGELLSRQLAFKNDVTRQNMMDSMQQILLDPSQTESVLTNRIKMIQEQGGDPSQTMSELEQFRTNPEGYEQKVERAYAIMDPKGYIAYRASMPQATEAMTAYQQATIDTKKTDQDLRRLEIEQKRLDAQYKRETDDLKRSELEQKIETNKAEQQAKATEKEQAKVNAQNFSNEVYDLATSIANDPQLNDITGPVNTMLPTVSGKSQDLINKAERLESMLTKENLGLMSGVLTDKDIQMLRSISSGINVTDGGIKGSYEGTKKRLNQIAEKIKSATGGAGQPTGSSFTSSSGIKFTVE